MEAAQDPSTVLGAELAGWAYPATTPELIGIVAQIANKSASQRVMPWALENPRRKKSDATAEEVAVATAALEDGIVFAS
ncbi:hypothetical protein [Leucobacter salsicius]|uniref:hypothetical protein n=1 Tax=Leucobacter salsicius TaxID=664638 RepID=UPI0018DBBF38|nr:hypothetical protein [Leucobacter salsicius]